MKKASEEFHSESSLIISITAIDKASPCTEVMLNNSYLLKDYRCMGKHETGKGCLDNGIVKLFQKIICSALAELKDWIFVYTFLITLLMYQY